MSYLTLRHLHVACAVLSVTLFALRGGLSFAEVDWRKRWPVLRWLPHLNDTVLLSAAVGLVVWSGQYPWQQAWVAAKIVALLAYIGLGKQALRVGLPTGSRAAWFAAALLSVAYIVLVALTRRVLPWTD